MYDDTEDTHIYCHTDLQEIIEEMFPQVANILRVLTFISDHELEAERNRYYAKKQCNAKPSAQPTVADMLGHVADSQ